MKTRLLILLSLPLFIGCAAFKQLSPKPELSGEENGYVELKNNEKDFILNPKNAYFIAFPKPAEDNSYIVIRSPQKSFFTGSMTASLIKKKTPGKRLADESPYKDTVFAFPVTTVDTLYYFLIEQVKSETPVTISYRYVPQWRYRFENGHARLRAGFRANMHDRTVYESVGSTAAFDNFNFTSEMDIVSRKLEVLHSEHRELLEIESIFPSAILNSQDPAYLDYQVLKRELEEEISFQQSYLETLKFFKNEFETRADTEALLRKTSEYAYFLKLKPKIAPNVFAQAVKVISSRYSEVVPFYDRKIAAKTDVGVFDSSAFLFDKLALIPDLYRSAEVELPQDITALSTYFTDYNSRVRDLKKAQDALASSVAMITELPQMPDNLSIKSIDDKVKASRTLFPSPVDGRYGKYLDMPCSQNFNTLLGNLTAEYDVRASEIATALNLVEQLNGFKDAGEYPSMVRLLAENRSIGFLIDKYSAVDSLSVASQAGKIGEALSAGSFASAENGLRILHNDNVFLNPEATLPAKERIVRILEDSLYFVIDRVTRSNVNKFLEEKIDTLEDIDSLYVDPVFLPVYDVTFSTGSNASLAAKKNDLIADLARLKENEFPMKAVQILYDRFLKDPEGLGVPMARAIVSHGKYYKGDDDKTKRRIAECDPWQSKWIVNEGQYRNVFALPITDNKNGVNTYFVRLNIRIKTDAKFPVYDVNIKVPKQIGQKAGTEQWYDKIMLNKELLKNEGRFTISAPTAANNFECQITPVRMDKDGNNLLDIYFKDKSFRVFPVGVMVQKPIIKKN